MARGASRTSGTRSATGHEPERTCALTREPHAPADLIRFVRAPDGTITPDLANRLPGRGVWLRLDRSVVEAAIKHNAFAKSLKCPVVVPEGLAALIEDLLRQRVLAALAIANKAGLVVAGFAKVETAIGTGKVAALVHASSAAADSSGKLDRRLRAVAASSSQLPAAQSPDAGASATSPSPVALGEPAPPSNPTPPLMPPVITDLDVHDLSLALGRENVVHAAVSRGGAAQVFLGEADRFRRYRSGSSAPRGRPPRTSSNTEQA